MKVRKRSSILSVNSLGSCIAVIAYCPKKRIGGIAHIMLPRKSPSKKTKNKYRYVFDGIDKLINDISLYEVNKNDIIFGIVGGANVLKRKHDKISQENIESVKDYFNKNNLKIIAKSIGGTNRRSAILNIKEGIAYYSVGNSELMVFWKNNNKNSRMDNHDKK